jgi:hypothetical protein
VRIFVHRRGLDHGPYSLEKVQQFLSNKQLSLGDFAWSSALKNSYSWLSLEQLLSSLEKIDPDCLTGVTDEIGEMPKHLQKIKDLLEKDEAELAFDLACGLGSSNELVFSELLEQCSIDRDGSLYLPPWIKSNYRCIDHTRFFVRLLGVCPEHVDLDKTLHKHSITHLRLDGWNIEIEPELLMPFPQLNELHWSGTRIQGLQEIAFLNHLQTLYLESADNLSNLVDLHMFKELKFFLLNHAEQLNSVVVENCKKLEKLDVGDWGAEWDNFKVKDCPSLRVLNVDASIISNVATISNLAELEDLNFNIYDRESPNDVIRISLEGCPMLKEASFRGGMIKTIEGLPGSSKLQNLALRNVSLDSLDLSNCISLENIWLDCNNSLKRLNLSNCLLVEDLDIDLRKIEFLNLKNCSDLQYLDLRHSQNLQRLNLEGCNSLIEVFLPLNEHKLKEFSWSKEVPSLQELGISLNNSFKDLGFLENAHELQTLHIYCNNEVNDLCFINSLKSLERLNLSELEGISSLDGLEGVSENLSYLSMDGLDSLTEFEITCVFPQLVELNLSALEIQDLNFLKAMPNLELLELNCPGLNDFSGLSNLSTLEELGMDQFLEGNLACLTNCSSLLKLSIYRADSLTSLESIQKLNGLESLFLQNCDKVSNLAPLGHLSQLKSLDLGLKDNGIVKDFSVFGNLTNLRDLTVCSDLLVDVFWLVGLVNLNEINFWNCSKLTNLDGFSTLSNLRQLNLSCCSSIKEVDALSGLTGLKELYLSNCEALSCINGLRNLMNLEYLDLTECDSIPRAQKEEIDAMLTNCDVKY